MHRRRKQRLRVRRTLARISRFPARGAIAQLGERLHGMQEVGGSIPPGSTIIPEPAAPAPTRVPTASPSSRGLGHHPFTVDTGVRIPVGTPSSNETGPLRRACFVWTPERSTRDRVGPWPALT